MDNSLTTALYLFSSLLQADATLLGLGAVFVIYKLQAIENQVTFVMQELKSHGTGYISLSTNLLVAKTDLDKATILKGALRDKLYEQLESIATLPEREKKIKRTFKPSLIIIALHLSLSAAALWLVPTLNERCGLLTWISWIFIIWFIVGVLFAVWVAWYLVAKDKELSLKEINPNLYSLIHS
jgi:hypothetical protein